MKKELTVVERVDELAIKSGTAFEFGVQELKKLSKQAKSITSIEDENFKEVKADMVTKRNYIKTYCLDARREIKKVAEGVSEVEEMLYELFVPEENRLIELSKQDKIAKEREERMKLLPRRKEDLAAIGDMEGVSDEELLGMDAAAFNVYLNERVTAKNESDRAENERVKEEQEKESQRLENEKNAQERENKARAEEKEKAELKIQEEKDQMEREAKEKEDREAKEKEEAEAAEIAEQEKLEKKKKYQKWLTDNNFNEETDRLIKTGDEVNLYKFVSKFKI